MAKQLQRHVRRRLHALNLCGKLARLGTPTCFSKSVALYPLSLAVASARLDHPLCVSRTTVTLRPLPLVVLRPSSRPPVLTVYASLTPKLAAMAFIGQSPSINIKPVLTAV